mgnify:CR=1 FL=1
MSSQLKAFIAQARQDPKLRQSLEDCSVDQWGESHTPLDVDPYKVIEVARDAGYTITLQDIFTAQCEQLSQFWRFEMENSFVARRSLARLQLSISDESGDIDYYAY